MRKRQKTKGERNEIFWRMSHDKKSGKLDRLETKDIAEIYDITPPVVTNWLKKIENNQDRAGNPIMESMDGNPFTRGIGWSANRVTVYPVPSDWQTIKVGTSKNIITGESIKDIYDGCSVELRMILWKLLSFEIISTIDPENFYYPQNRIANEITGQSIPLKVSPNAYDIWLSIKKSGTTSKSNWAVETVVKPFFLHIGLI